MKNKEYYIQEIENIISKHLNIKNVKLCGSGTESFINIINNIKLRKNDEILIPNFTCEILMAPIIKNKVKYRLVDVDYNKIYPSLRQYKEQYNTNTKVIIICYLWGYIPDDINDIIAWARSKKLIIIEDIASSYNLSYQKTKIGMLGDYTFGSFGKGKLLNVDKYGFYATNNDISKWKKVYICPFKLFDYTKTMKYIRKIKNYSIRNKIFKMFIKNYKMFLWEKYDDSFQTLYNKLCNIKDIYIKRKKNTMHFIKKIKINKNINYIIPNNDQSIASRVVCLTDNEEVILKLKENGCWVGLDFKYPINYFLSDNKMNHSELIRNKIFNLLTDANNNTVDETIEIINNQDRRL